ncbi:hypothetical protein DXU93_13945 [Brumimicrobium aurantiacum]|uniref:Uncharacterized protein n=2 Tax=Brumimicrobium aurantiacum TaxID=1737063 RepID=A0A3E1EUT5_9FLAO|nr:hypothetical protein DXU93_13945 [Brumimicrobium aurantiacum]
MNAIRFSGGIFFMLIFMQIKTNRMNLKAILTIFASAILLFACNIKQIEKYNEEFNGKWRTDVFYSPTKADTSRNYLTVDGKNSGFGVACHIDDSFEECLVFQTGKIKINSSTKAVQFGNSVSQIHYVTQEPFINTEGVWELSLDSIQYFKY